MKTILAVVLAVLAGACGRQENKSEPSTAEQVIDGVTGRGAVKQYLDTKQTIKEIEVKQKERYDKIPGHGATP